MSKRASRKQTANQRILWVLSLLLAASMVISLIVVALPEPARTTPTPQPTEPPPATATPPATETLPVVGPELPTATDEPAPGPTATPSSGLPGLRFAVAGDSRGNPEVYQRVLASVAQSGAAFLIHTGDLVNKGEEAAWQEFRQTMSGFALPFYPVPGNHDGLGGKLDGYLASSGATQAHYSFDYRPLHFSLADSHDGGVSGAELEWLRQDLKASGAPLEIVVLHHPPFDPDGSDHIMAYGNEPFMALMEEQGVDYVFAGHIHGYALAERNGVVYVYTGGAGAPLYEKGHPEAYYHYLLVRVESGQVTIEVVRL